MYIHGDFITLVAVLSIVGALCIAAVSNRIKNYSSPVQSIIYAITLATSSTICLFLFSSKLGGISHLAAQAGKGTNEGMYRGYKMTLGEAPF